MEFWAEVEGHPFLVRIADIGYVKSQLRANGVQVIDRFATELWDVYRFRAGTIRNAVIRLNAFWFRLRLPAARSIGNALIGRK